MQPSKSRKAEVIKNKTLLKRLNLVGPNHTSSIRHSLTVCVPARDNPKLLALMQRGTPLSCVAPLTPLMRHRVGGPQWECAGFPGF